MAKNESMEGKNLAADQKKEFEKRILEAIQDLRTGQTTISTEGIEVTNYGEQYTIKLRGITFGIIDKEGKFTYNRESFKAVKKALKEEGKTLEDLGLPDLEQSIDQEKEPDEQEKDGKEPEQTAEDEKTEQEGEEEEQEGDIEKDKEKIAEELGIDPRKIYPIRTDSAFYKNHPGMFPGKNLFFYEDEQGKFKVGTRDENGKPIEDTEHFTSNGVAQMEAIIELGDGRKNVGKEIPLQTIGIKNPAKENGEEDVLDRFIAIKKGDGGYPEFMVVEQSRENGKFVGERIEVSGRDYNTHEVNEHTNNRNGGQTPGETATKYEAVKESKAGEDGVQLPELGKTFEEQVKKDIIKRHGPTNSEELEKRYQRAKKDIEKGVDYDIAIGNSIGEVDREPGGRTPGEKRGRCGE